MAVEHLLASERDFHGPARDHRQLRRDDLVAEGVALATEPAPVGAGDHADAGRRELEHLGEGAVDVVGRLGGAPQRELPVRRPVGHGRVLFHREVRAALEEERVLAHQVGVPERLLHVAELEVDQLVQVPLVTVVVDAGFGVGEGVLGIGDRAQRLVANGDAGERGGGRLLGGRGDGRHGIAHETDLVERQRMLVLAHRENAKGDGQILAGEHPLHAREPGCGRGVDGDDASVGVGTAEQFGVQHAGQEQIVGEPRRAGDFRRRIDLPERFPDHAKGALTGCHTSSPVPARPARRACGPPPAQRPRRS